MRVLIAGGGVIGTSIAYFLARRGAEPIVIEPTGIACAASGKSGGFLALDWCDGTPLRSLARRSFALHAELAEELGGESWGYRRLDTFGAFVSSQSRALSRPRASGVDWIADTVVVDRQLGSTATTAQVHPGAFTTAMMRAAEARGAKLRRGAVTDLVFGADRSRLRGVEVDGDALEGDAVVIAMGPWSIVAAGWLPLPRIFGLKGHSIVFETSASVPAQSLFLEYQEPDGSVITPEVFPRADGTTYVCAISSESPVPPDATGVTPDVGALDRLQTAASRLSPHFAAERIVARQACYRPVTADGLPLIGAIVGAEGAYVGTGHSVWGILNAPATGEAMAELILDGVARSVDLAAFVPNRLRPFGAPRQSTA